MRTSLRRLSGRLPVESRVGLGAAVVVLVAVSAAEATDGPATGYIGLLAAAPLITAAFASWPEVVVVGGVATVLGVVFGFDVRWSTASAFDVAAIIVATGFAAWAGNRHILQVTRVAELARLAAVAQRAVLSPLGPQLGQLAIAGRYISASAAADIGGDLYEAVDTDYGVRMIIGDVRGKGLDAVRLASIVLGSYRHVAHERADLRTIVADLDRAVSRSVGDEDFVTVVIAEERGGTLTIVNCGHPPPLLLRRGQVIPLVPPTSAPPLGFMPAAQTRVDRLEPGDRILLYTDGLAEARRDGAFFPIDERAWGLLGHGTVADGLASLESALVDWVAGQLDDDIALVLMEYAGTSIAPAVPSWEVGAMEADRAKS